MDDPCSDHFYESESTSRCVRALRPLEIWKLQMEECFAKIYSDTYRFLELYIIKGKTFPVLSFRPPSIPKGYSPWEKYNQSHFSPECYCWNCQINGVCAQHGYFIVKCISQNLYTTNCQTVHCVPGESILCQKYAFIKKSTILSQSLRNFVKMGS